MCSFSFRGFFFFLASLSISTTSASTIVDLSKSFEVGNLDSSGAQKVIDAVSQDYTRRFLVLEKGKIVVDYSRPDNVCNTMEYYGLEFCGAKPDDRSHLFSVTKSVNDGFGIGLLVNAGLISQESTLGDIFTDDSTWENVTNAEYKRSVSIKELLTMSSGLVDCAFLGTCPEIAAEEYVECPIVVEGPCVSEFGGRDLIEVLNRLEQLPEVVKRGEYFYIALLSFISYIFKEVAGQGMRDYMASNVYPTLGIDDNDIFWTVNGEGVEQTGSGLYLSAYEMAKFGQLYLQKGMSAPNESLISAEWVNESFTAEVYDNTIEKPPYYVGYGYFWIIYKTSDGDEVPCADGGFGQHVCVHRESERVFVRKSDDDSAFLGMENLVLNGLENDIEVVFSKTTVFESDAEDGNVAPSGAACAMQAMNLVVTILATFFIIAP